MGPLKLQDYSSCYSGNLNIRFVFLNYKCSIFHLNFREKLMNPKTETIISIEIRIILNIPWMPLEFRIILLTNKMSHDSICHNINYFDNLPLTVSSSSLRMSCRDMVRVPPLQNLTCVAGLCALS